MSQPRTTIAISFMIIGIVLVVNACKQNANAYRGTKTPTSQLLLSVSALIRDRPGENLAFRVMFENATEKDITLNLGISYAGRQYPAVILVLTDSKGRSSQLHVPGPGVIGGRVDVIVLPLRSGSTHSLRLSLDQLAGWAPFSDGVKELSQGRYAEPPKLLIGSYRVRAEFKGERAQIINSGQEDLRFVHFWEGTLQSDEVAFQIH